MARLLELARYAVENAWRSRLRTMLTVIGIMIASGALVSMVGFVLGLRLQFEAPLRELGLLSSIQVRPQNDTDQGDADSHPVLDDAMLQRIEGLPGVDYVYPDFRISEVELVRSDQQRCSAYVVGIPREASLIGLTRNLLAAGSFFSLGEAEEVILGEKLVSQLGFDSPAAALGQQLDLHVGGLVAKKESRDFEFQREQLNLVVVGIYRPPAGISTSMGADAALLPVDLMRKMPEAWMEGALRRLTQKGEAVKGFTRVTVRAKSPTDVLRVEKKIRELGFFTLSVVTRIAEMRRFFVFMEVLLTAVGTVALVVAGVGILNTLLMTVMERYQEIGIYKSIGASNADIRWLFLIEAGIVGLAGGIMGLGLARVVSWILGWAFNIYAKSQGVEGPSAVFVFPWWLLAGAVAYAMLISIGSGLYPASRAANVDPIQALRRN